MRLRPSVRVFSAGGVIVTGILGAVLAAPRIERSMRAHAFASAVAAAVDHTLSARIVTAPRLTVASFPVPSQERRDTALVRAIENATTDMSVQAQHDAGLARLVTGSPDEAVRHLRNATRAGGDAIAWTHTGAAEFALALQRQDPEHLLASLGASFHALRLDPRRAEAAYNFALAVEHLGIPSAAAEMWRQYLELPDGEAHRAEARRHLARLEAHRGARTEWQAAVSRLDATSEPELRRLARTYPQEARKWFEREGLARWADSMRTGDARAARLQLDRARIVAETLRCATGESLLTDAVTSIDSALAANDVRRITALTEGHLAFRLGLDLFGRENLGSAEKELTRAAACFQDAGSAMGALARAYTATVLHDSDRVALARERLDVLWPEERSRGPTHLALLAQLRYQIGRTDTIRGFWSDSIAASADARVLYRRAGERGNEGMAGLTLAEAHDFIGQSALALQHSLAAVRLLSDAGDSYRVRVALAVLSRMSIRRGLWDTARAILRIERAIESLAPDEVLTTDTCIRAAVIEESTRRPRQAKEEIRRARLTAAQIPDTALRASLIADIDGAAGVLARDVDPRNAVKLLSDAIHYQEQTERTIMLPQLHLERGRAHLACGDSGEALDDFERGIAQLERQRSHVNDTDLRYGLFDNAHELFPEAVSLWLARHEPKAAFSIVERGRARALLEEIAADAAPFAAVEVEAVQREMPPGTLLIEYAVLPDRLAIFLVAADLFEVRTVHTRAASLETLSEALTDALAERRSIAEVQRRSASLHALLIEPVHERSAYEHLVFVPDATLTSTPFAALFDRRSGKYLVEQHIPTTAPSAAVFVASASRSRRFSGTGIRNVAVFANAAAYPELSLDSLPNAEREAVRVRRRYEHGRLYTGRQSSAARFLAEAPGYDAVHFAGHGLIDSANPAKSALVMAGAQDGVAVRLPTREIARAKFHRTRVVVLAACSTMRSRMGRTEGTPSISRSFIAAGVPSVIGTIADVDDGDAATMAAIIHRHLAAGDPPAVALREAQLAAIHGTALSQHPATWGAFCVLGAGV